MMIDTPVTVCFVIPQNQDEKFEQKSFKQKKICDDFTVDRWVNSAYLLTSHDMIRSNHVHVFCVDVEEQYMSHISPAGRSPWQSMIPVVFLLYLVIKKQNLAPKTTKILHFDTQFYTSHVSAPTVCSTPPNAIPGSADAPAS